MITAFVHAKGNSTRVANKNLQMLGDFPLFVHAINNCLKSNKIDNIIIDSDSDEILYIGESYGAIPLKRPTDLATNAATGDDLMFWQASNYPESEIVLQVIPTSPFIKSKTIDKAINLLISKNVNSVVGVHSETLYLWENNKPIYYKDGKIPNSFDLQLTTYETTGLYVNKTSFVLNNKKRLDPNNCHPIFLSKIESIDINTMEDLDFAKIIIAGLKA